MKTFLEYVQTVTKNESMYNGLIGTLASKNPTILRNMPGSIFAKAPPVTSTKEGGVTMPWFELQRTTDMYRKLGGNGKSSVPYPGMPGFYLHPNGIVGPGPAEGDEHLPIFDPYEEEGTGFGTIDTKIER